MLPRALPLNGVWQLLPVETFHQGLYPAADAAWLEQELPAHWQQHPLLERHVGKVVYRRRFTLDEAAGATERYWLRLNGAFYWSQPYFNGVDLGRHEGYFIPQEHEVTPWVAAENTLVVEVECPDERNKLGKRLITGVFSHWDSMDQTANPGGIWQPVELIASGPVRLKHAVLQTEAAGEARAELRFWATLDAAAGQDVTLRWTFAPHNFAGAVQTIEQRRALAAGEQDLAGVLELRDPQLWWTHDIGHPSCYRVTLEVLTPQGVSDARSFSFGIRTFELHSWIAYLNGVRLFVKGSNYPPTDVRIATATPERVAVDLRLARECHMNLLRVHGHIGHPALYEAADEAGVLLWQDFPLHWLYRREIAPEAERQAREMVRLLGNHPSVALWCMHNEPLHVADTSDERMRTRLRTYYSVFVWSWNRDVLDTRLKRAVEQADTTRPVVRSSNEYAVPLLRAGTSSHFYFGWYRMYGKLRSWEPIVRRFPRNMRFVTEFGAQSFPNVESCLKFMDADVARLDERRLAQRHQWQPEIMAYWYDWRAARSLDELVQRSQDYQSHVNRFFVDRLRHAKYRPTGGIVPFMFQDANPSVSWSVVDYWRVPKRSYDALRLAFSPQYAFTLLDQDAYPPDVPLQLPIYVVNDAHADVPVRLEALLEAPDGAALATLDRRFTLPSDSMALEIDRLQLTPPRPGTYRLVLRLEPEDGEPIRNVYEIVVRA